jgi:hypothetical protein
MEATDIERHTRDAEVEAIKRVVNVLEHAQQNELPDEFVGLFRQDAIWTTRSRRSHIRYSLVR